MKKTACINYMVFVLMILMCIILCPAEGYSQTGLIDEVMFEPSAPQPGDELRLYLTLFPSAEEQKEVSIHLSTYTDSNNDYKYQPNEIVKHPIIHVQDNEAGKDEEDFEDEILVSIYNVPLEQPPEKYTVQVTCDKDIKSASITASYPKPLPSGPTGSFSTWNPLKIPHKVLFDVVKNLGLITRVVRDTKEQNNYNLYIYTPENNRLERITQTEKDTLYLSPSWSPDSTKIACIIKQGVKKSIVWFEIAEKIPHLIKGRDDRAPYWLPDNRRILFLRDSHLWIIDTSSEEMLAIAKEIQVDQILGILTGEENRLQILYKAANTAYLMELNSQFEPVQDGMSELVDTPAWYLTKLVSPSGEHVVFSKKVNSAITLFLEATTEDQQERLFNDEYNYIEPCWSPDGNSIVFVSDRP